MSEKFARVDGSPLFAKNDAEFRTVSEHPDYVNAYRYSPVLEVAKYKVEWYCEITSDSGTYRAHARVRIDETTVLGEFAHEPEAIGEKEFIPCPGWDVYDCTVAGQHHFDLDLCIENDVAEAVMRRRRILLTKIGEVV